MKKLFLVILISINSIFFVKADSSQKIPSYDPTVNFYVDIGTSIGVGLSNYGKNKKTSGLSFGINKSLIKGKTNSCGVAQSVGGEYFCYVNYHADSLVNIEYEVSNDFFLNFGIQKSDRGEIGLLLGYDAYTPNYTAFKKETVPAFGFYYKKYFVDNLSLRMGFLTSSIDRGARDEEESLEIHKKNGKKGELRYTRIEFTTGYRFQK